jgi:hypothetical protein
MHPADRNEMRQRAQTVLHDHHPDNQDHPYPRCALCQYTRHPCDQYAMAAHMINLLDVLDM